MEYSKAIVTDSGDPQQHVCKRNMICLEERIFKCYKCLDREKEYLAKEELPGVLVPICKLIAEREVYGEKCEKFVKYQTQQVFTEEEINDIMETQKIPDEQNPDIIEIRTIMRRHSLKLSNFDEQVQTIYSLRQQVADLKRTIDLLHVPSYLTRNINNIAIEFVNKQKTAESLLEYENLFVEPWMLEFALRSGKQDVLDRLLNRYFKGIKIELLPIQTCTHENCQVVNIVTQYTSTQNQSQNESTKYQYLHIQYEDQLRFEYCRISIPYLCYTKSDANAEGELIMHSFIKHYFGLDIKILSHIPNFINTNNYSSQRDIQIQRFSRDGKLALYNLNQGQNRIFVENGKLHIKKQ